MCVQCIDVINYHCIASMLLTIIVLLMNKRFLLLIAYFCVYDSIPEMCLEKLDGQVEKQSTCPLIY